MARRRLAPTDTELRKMLEHGMTYQQIADEMTRRHDIPVSVATIRSAASRAGLANIRPSYPQMVPRGIPASKQTNYDLEMLRVAARVEAGDPNIPEDKRRRFESWRRRLEDLNAIIVYVPDTEEMFWAVPRREGEEGVIRLPKESKPRARARA